VLGRGGQGEVSLVRKKAQGEHQLLGKLFKAWPDAERHLRLEQRAEAQSLAANLLSEIIGNRLNVVFGALKVLHQEGNARDPKRARQRAAQEIEAMTKWKHPNLLSLLDFDAHELWYVSEFHDKGTLNECLAIYAGNLAASLMSIRPMVEGVALLHQHGVVHRDIKPQNIFIGSENKFVLGDFGLVYVPNPDAPRLSETHSNVGTHAWMPGWAMERRIDEITPAFDVFSLGKIIWSMISGKPTLTLWYHQRDDNNLTKLFPERPEMQLANRLLDKCIVEHEKDCLQDAGALLNEIDSILRETYHASPNARHCRICNRGQYVELARTNGRGGASSDAAAKDDIKTYYCDFCGHITQFLSGKFGLSTVASPVLVSGTASRFIDVDDTLAKLASNFERLWSHEIQQNRPAADATKNVVDRFAEELANIVERFGERLPSDVVSDLNEAKTLLSGVYSTWRSYSKNRQEEFLDRIAAIRKRLEIHSGLH
jgi:serine/threonine protein kinase